MNGGERNEAAGALAQGTGGVPARSRCGDGDLLDITQLPTGGDVLADEPDSPFVALRGIEEKRRYEAAFVSKLSDAEAEAAETQTHIEFAVKCGYATRQEGVKLYREYERLIKTIVGMIRYSERWVIHTKRDDL